MQLKQKAVALILFVVWFLTLIMISCNHDNSGTDNTEDSTGVISGQGETERPEGWTEETHGKSASPNYDVVFTEGKVHRIDVTITSEK